MKIVPCPINGPRPLQEFHFGGEVRDMPEGSQLSDQDWANYVFHRRGEPAVKREWWYHVPSGVWFIAERNNQTDEFVRSYLLGEGPEESEEGAQNG